MTSLGDRVAGLSRAQRALLEHRLRSFERKSQATQNAVVQPATAEQPLTVMAAEPDTPLNDWIEKNKSQLESLLLEHGAILFRGFSVDGAAGFEQCIQSGFGETTDYPGLAQGVVLRQRVSGKIFTSTEYSSAFNILLHNECAFADTWPAQICFYCVSPPATGGETPIADSRRVLKGISATTRSKLEKLGVLYVRNFGYGESRAWQKTFNTNNQAEVEAVCRAEGVTCEWLDESRLRTSALRPPLAVHPVTQEQVWFNHVHASHISSLAPALRQTLLNEFGTEGLPRNCYYGDGSEIEAEVLEEISSAFAQHTKAFTWQKGDVLVLDNMLSSHGRNPFTGTRKIVVGMAGAVRRSAR